MNPQGKQQGPATKDSDEVIMTQLAEAGALALRALGFESIEDNESVASQQFSRWLADLDERRPDLKVKKRVAEAFAKPDPLNSLTEYLEELRDQLADKS